MKLLHFLFTLLLFCAIIPFGTGSSPNPPETAIATNTHHHNHSGVHHVGHRRRRRFGRHPRRKDFRKIRSSADCGPHEEFNVCGPEPHCEISCENLFSPPRCKADLANPRCFYPRCVCASGYVRDVDGYRCIAEWRCRMEHHGPRKVVSPAASKVIGVKRNPFAFKKSNPTVNFW
uniref:TIL domain-containing protein n=1 Tax=Panagrellus redivivus TaxID=6233 RepID=A0A7E4WCH4_PANRE